jgi:hypothetical protein
VTTGSCLCGKVAFELTGIPARAHSCYCERCRKISGAAFAPNLFVLLEGFDYTRGEELLQSFKLPGADRFTHVFCRECGSSLPFISTTRGLAVIPMGSLDSDPGMAPRNHIYVGSKASWVEITDTLPQHEFHYQDRPKGS